MEYFTRFMGRGLFGVGFRILSGISLHSRSFGTKRVIQKRKHMMKILHPMQTEYEPKPEGHVPIPISVLGSGALRRLVYTNTSQAHSLLRTVQWDKYKSTTKGVRWHPSGAWRVQFCRRNYERNFHVKVNCYFRVTLYGFEGAKSLAVGYRKRLEAEWDELKLSWERLDREEAEQKVNRKKEKSEMYKAARDQEGFVNP